MATINDVAERAGVARSTVSKVMLGNYYVSARTREKVLSAATELGYRPNLAARALSKGRTFVLGLLIPYDPNQVFADPHLLGIIRGVEEAANRRDYNVLLSTARRGDDPTSAYSRVLRSNYVDGMIVHEGASMQPLATQLLEQSAVWVISGYDSTGAGVPCIHADDSGITAELAGHLLELGHRRFGAISAARRPLGFDQRLLGFRRRLAEDGIELPDTAVADGDMSVASGYHAATQLLNREDRPTAIFALNDRMALGALQCAREFGLRVPQDISIAGFDDNDAASHSNPPLTTVRLPSYREGQEAAALLFRLLERQPVPDETIVRTEVVVRSSTGHVPR